jgi:predicted LPLAT superfamily acyltransferase/glycosyltransferase involved in cell wall biosynthesis
LIIRLLVVIPTYNNPETIAEVTKSIREVYSYPILILDDGSDTPVENIVSNIKGLTILRNQENMGKGFSIRRSFDYALENDFTHVLTIDGDGQHKAKDIVHFTEKIKEDPFSLIIGKRILEADNVPEVSKFGRKFSNFWVKYQTDKVIEDSQSGYRCYPVFHIQDMNFFTTRYDFEIEVLVRLLWKKVQVHEVQTDVYYPPQEERVSHFNKLWDNVKISLLNTLLVVISLIRSNLSSHKIASSIALGFFFAVQPIYGFQIFFLGLFAFIFKLNFTLMFTASQISIPPMIPLWTFISLKIGSLLTGAPLLLSLSTISIETAKESLLSWIIGSLVLGCILAASVYLIYFIAIIIKGRDRAPKENWDGKDRGGKAGNLFMEKIISIAGQDAAYFFLFFICPYFYLFARKAAGAQSEYFKHLRPEDNFIARQFNVIKVFFRLGQSLIDNKLVKYRDINYFKVNRNGNENLIPNGKGHIIIGVHTGGWLLAAKFFTEDLSDEKTKINIVEFSATNGESSNKQINDSNINFIGSNDPTAIFKINKALDAGETVIFMTDRVVSHTTEQLTFLSGQTFFDKNPFKIAYIKDIPISYAFAFKTQKRVYDLFITPRQYYKRSGVNKELEIKIMMDDFILKLEEKLTKYPYQWFNFFSFWSTIPTPLLSSDRKKKHTTLKEELL